MPDRDWQDQAKCRTDLTFTDRPLDQQSPICRRCPVRGECIELGISLAPTDPAHTVAYGGIDPGQLVRLADDRGRAPRLLVHRCASCGARFKNQAKAALYCTPRCRRRASDLRRPKKAVA